MEPGKTIQSFDAYLDERGITFEGVIIGGSALVLLGIVSRPTRDCDLMHPALPKNIEAAARAFAAEARALGDDLADDWLNDKPGPLKDNLPEGWQKRVQPAFQGKAITFQTLGRLDLIRSKLFALCDRGTDLEDCQALAPTAAEMEEIRPWLEFQDGNPMWPDHVRDTLDKLRQRLGHDLNADLER